MLKKILAIVWNFCVVKVEVIFLAKDIKIPIAVRGVTAFAVFNLSYSSKTENSSVFVGCRSPPFDLDFKKIQTNGGNSVGAGKKKIWIHGQFIEVTDEVYAAYMKGDRKNKIF